MHGLVPIVMQGACDLAALALGRDFTLSSTHLDEVTAVIRPPGCFIRKSGKLSWNPLATSEHIYGTDDEQSVVCVAEGDCDGNAFTGGGENSQLGDGVCDAKFNCAKFVWDDGDCGRYARRDYECDEVEYCTIQSKADCELASVFVDEPENGWFDKNFEPGLELAREVDRTDRVRGCSERNSGVIAFNTNLEAPVAHNNRRGKSVLCTACETTPAEYDMQTMMCDGVVYCHIMDEATCNAAAAMLGHPDSGADVVTKTNRVKGCSVRNSGNLVFNDDMSSTSSKQGQTVFCQRCESQM